MLWNNKHILCFFNANFILTNALYLLKNMFSCNFQYIFINKYGYCTKLDN